MKILSYLLPTIFRYFSSIVVAGFAVELILFSFYNQSFLGVASIICFLFLGAFLSILAAMLESFFSFYKLEDAKTIRDGIVYSGGKEFAVAFILFFILAVLVAFLGIKYANDDITEIKAKERNEVESVINKVLNRYNDKEKAEYKKEIIKMSEKTGSLKEKLREKEREIKSLEETEKKKKNPKKKNKSKKL